jgi:DNA-binding NarL/FixJ family response regulator
MTAAEMPTASSADSSGRIRVFMIDDHPPIRDAVATAFEDTLDVVLCGEATAADEGVRRICSMQPDVAVVDISLNDAHGLEVVETLREQAPSVRSVVYSMWDETIYAERAVRAGAAGYVMKTEPTGRLLEAIRRVDRGEMHLSRRMATRILQSGRGTAGPGPAFAVDQLTDREREVLRLLGQGETVEGVKRRLGLSRKTVETYRRRAKEKLGYDSVSELLLYALHWTYGTGDEASSGGENGSGGQPAPRRRAATPCREPSSERSRK